MIRWFIVLFIATVGLGVVVSCAKKTPEQKLREAEAAYRKRDPLGAIVLAHEILREQTTGPIVLQARKLLVSCHSAGNDIRACRLVLNDIINQVGLDHPDGREGARLKIRTYEVVRQTTEALAQVQSFLVAVTTGTTFWAELMLKQGDLLRATDQLTTALNVYASVLRKKELPEFFYLEVLNRLAGSYATTQSAAAGVEFFKKYLADEPATQTIPHAWMITGHLHSVLKDTEGSKAAYEKAFEAFGRAYELASGADEKTAVLIHYARAHDFAGDVEQAAALFRTGLKEFPTSSMKLDLYYNLAWMYVRNKMYDEAIQVCREIPPQFPNDPRGTIRSYFLAADCHRFQKKYDAAVADYREIMALFPGTDYAQQAMIEIRRTEEIKRKEAETSATLAVAPATTATLAATTGTTAVRPRAAPPTSPTAPLLPEKNAAPPAPQARLPVAPTSKSVGQK